MHNLPTYIGFLYCIVFIQKLILYRSKLQEHCYALYPLHELLCGHVL